MHKIGKQPREIIERHRNVTLAIDIMAINRIPYIVTTSINIQCGTAHTRMEYMQR